MRSNLMTAPNQKTLQPSCDSQATNSRTAAVFILEVCTGQFNFYINTESFFQLQESITINPQKPMQFHITAGAFSALSLFPSASRLNEESKLQYQWARLSRWNAKRAVGKNVHPQLLRCCAAVVKNSSVCLAINTSSKTGHLQTQQSTVWEFCRQPDTVFSATCCQPHKLVYDRDRLRDTFPEWEKSPVTWQLWSHFYFVWLLDFKQKQVFQDICYSLKEFSKSHFKINITFQAS